MRFSGHHRCFPLEIERRAKSLAALCKILHVRNAKASSPTMKLMLSKSPVFAVLAFNLLRVSCDSTRAGLHSTNVQICPLECLMAIDRSVQEWPKDFICDIDLVPKVAVNGHAS